MMFRFRWRDITEHRLETDDYRVTLRMALSSFEMRAPGFAWGASYRRPVSLAVNGSEPLRIVDPVMLARMLAIVLTMATMMRRRS